VGKKKKQYAPFRGKTVRFIQIDLNNAITWSNKGVALDDLGKYCCCGG
jgi:hypothetical protein